MLKRGGSERGRAITGIRRGEGREILLEREQKKNTEVEQEKRKSRRIHQRMRRRRSLGGSVRMREFSNSGTRRGQKGRGGKGYACVSGEQVKD